MVSKNSRMGNLVGSACTIYKVRSRLRRESGGRQNRGSMQMVNKFSVWKFPLGILDYLSRNPVFSGNFSFWEDQNMLTIYIPTEISEFFVNGQQPLFRTEF